MDIRTWNERTLAHTLLFIKWVMIWTFAVINLSCMSRAKFLSKSFIVSSLRLSCLRTNNRISLGELMHPKCTHFTKPFAQCFDLESPILEWKLQNLTLFLAKSSFCLFLQEINSGKNTTQIFHEKKQLGLLNLTRGAMRARSAQVARPPPLDAPPGGLGRSGLVSASPLAHTFI